MDSSKVIFSCAVVAISTIAAFLYYRKNRKPKLPRKWVPVGRITELFIYPLKSGYRYEVTEAECTYFGLKQIADKGVYKLQDRFLVTYNEPHDEFRTGRTHQQLVLITVSNHDVDHVALDAPGMRTLYVKIPNFDEKQIKMLKLRHEEVEMIDCGDEAASWLSRYVLEKDSGLRLGFHDEQFKSRKIHRHKYRFYPNLNDNDMGFFPDLSAFLLINKSSINDLNNRLKTPATAYQFRPNIIIENVVAYAEDDWKWLKIGDEATFYCVKPCTRCMFTTVDSETGIRSKEREPLKTLEQYRQIPDEEERKAAGNSPVMGVNLGLRNPGVIKCGDILYVGVP